MHCTIPIFGHIYVPRTSTETADKLTHAGHFQALQTIITDATPPRVGSSARSNTITTPTPNDPTSLRVIRDTKHVHHQCTTIISCSSSWRKSQQHQQPSPSAPTPQDCMHDCMRYIDRMKLAMPLSSRCHKIHKPKRVHIVVTRYHGKKCIYLIYNSSTNRTIIIVMLSVLLRLRHSSNTFSQTFPTCKDGFPIQSSLIH